MLGIAFRLFGLWCLVQVLFVVPQMYSTAVYALLEDNISTSQFYSMSAAFVVVGLLLVVAVMKLGAQASELATSKSINSSVSLEHESVLYQLLGVFFVISAFAVIPGASARLMIGVGETDRSWVTVAWLAGYLLQLGMGASLVLWPARWAVFLSRFRRTGH